jgi:hypothetical protein
MRRSLLDHAPGIHDADAIGQSGDHRIVVIHSSAAPVSRESFSSEQDLPLDGYVQRGLSARRR